MTAEQAAGISPWYSRSSCIPGLYARRMEAMSSSWQGQYQGAKKIPTLILEAATDFNLFLWHSSFSHPGSLKDINVWDRSELLKEFNVTFDSDVDFEFEIGGVVFHQVSFLLIAAFCLNY